MTEKKDNVYAKCPFFKSHAVQHIKCEGMEPYTSSVQNFSGRGTKKDYFEQICCTFDYKRCLWARTLLARYEEKK